MHEEWHITVEGDPFQWRGFCTQLGIKPLWIELNTFERQLMCAITPHMLDEQECTIEGLQREIERSFKVVRFKHEVQPSDPAQLGRFGPNDIVYYECHVKIDGPFRPELAMSSRDLFRADRWYVTRRSHEAFEPTHFVRSVQDYMHRHRKPALLAGWEYEAAVRDSNPNIDRLWVEHAEVCIEV